jgi:gluconolactonase
MKHVIHHATALLVLLSAALPAAAQEQVATTPAITGVVNAGTPIVLVKDGFEAVEGPVPTRDDELLFSNNRTSQIMRVAKDGTVSEWASGTGGANAFTWTLQGELAATQVGDIAVAVVKPGAPPRVLAKEFEGKPLNRPNDLVASKLGNIYFSDTPSPGVTDAPQPPSVYQLTPQGKLIRVVADIARPNGVALSPDERRLYVANTSGEWVLVFDLDVNGTAQGHRNFARLATPPAAAGQPPAGGADGMAVDADGRLYVATTLGVQVFSPQGEALGTIALPKQPQNLAFSGPGRSTLYVVGRGAVYSIATRTHGPQRAGK